MGSLADGLRVAVEVAERVEGRMRSDASPVMPLATKVDLKTPTYGLLCETWVVDMVLAWYL